MKPRAFIAFLLLILLALSVIAYLGYEISRNESTRTSKRYQALISQQLHDIDANFQSQLLSLEQELTQSYKAPNSTPSPLINHLFRLDVTNQLTQPTGPDLSAKAQAFLTRTRSIWQSGLQLTDNTESPPLLNQKPNATFGNIKSRNDYTLKSQATINPTGWHAWFYDNDVHLLHWMKFPDGTTIGSEINRSAFLSRLIGNLPAGDSLPDARIILRSATQQNLYQWGTYQPPKNAPPILTLTLAAPLETWSLQYHSPLIPKKQSRLTKPVLLNLAALALAFLIIALWFLRENNRALREAARRVSFVNQVSHELKTPLTNIRLYSELASQSLSPDEPAAQQLDIVTSETSRLSRLINNVLSFARSERKQLQLNLQALDLNQTLDNILTHWIPTLDKAGVKIETNFPDSPQVLADPDACEQILGNLLSNIEKYAAHGKIARLSTQQQSGQILITLTDYGSGIPSTARKRIFAPFSRLHSSLTEGTSGTGIGLSIARELAHQMDGTLTLAPEKTGQALQPSQSSPSVSPPGATFLWTLPLLPSADPSR